MITVTDVHTRTPLNARRGYHMLVHQKLQVENEWQSTF